MTILHSEHEMLVCLWLTIFIAIPQHAKLLGRPSPPMEWTPWAMLATVALVGNVALSLVLMFQ